MKTRDKSGNHVFFTHTWFTWFKDNRYFSAELSDLVLWSPGLMLLLQGKKEQVMYEVRHIHKDSDGDVQYWELFPTEYSQRRVPACSDTRVIIYND